MHCLIPLQITRGSLGVRLADVQLGRAEKGKPYLIDEGGRLCAKVVPKALPAHSPQSQSLYAYWLCVSKFASVRVCARARVRLRACVRFVWGRRVSAT